MRLPTASAALAALLLALPSMASAGDVTARYGTGGASCAQPTDAKGQKTVDKFGLMLGSSDSRKAWKALVKTGKTGCTAVFDWLKAGGAGEEGAGLRDVATVLVEDGDDEMLNLGASYLMSDDRETTLSILGALEQRLALLTAEQTAWLAANPDEEIRRKALGVLIGYHSTGAMVAKRYGPVTTLV